MVGGPAIPEQSKPNCLKITTEDGVICQPQAFATYHGLRLNYSREFKTKEQLSFRQSWNTLLWCYSGRKSWQQSMGKKNI
jgi:hypothetical protein